MKRLPSLVMRVVTELLAADRSTLFLFDPGTMELRSCFAEGMAEESAIVVPLRSGIIGTAILQRKIFNLTDAYQHPYFNPEIDAHSGYKTDSLLVVPLIHGSGQVLGGIELLNKSTGRFTADDERLVEEAARQIVASGSIDSEPINEHITALHRRIEFDRGTLFRLDSHVGQLTAMYAEGAESFRISLNMKLGIAGLVAMTGIPLLIPDAYADPRFDATLDRRTGYRTRNILCVPLRAANNDALGVIQVINRLDGDFLDEDLDLLVNVAGIVSIAVESAMLFQDSERQFHSLLRTLAASIDARDSMTADHSKRVAQISLGIARELGFVESDLELLEVSALLHDYGKIGIDDAVLKKEGKLDAREFKCMQRHADLTFEILNQISFSRKYCNVPLIASLHHEALDGSGYPKNLSHKEIPFMSRILAVADVFEALTADRHYRKGMSINRSLEIIDDEVGRKLDSRAVAALKRYLDHGGLAALGLK
ncbi:MAG: GAF domain-containing protein [Sterolibacterium sp.]|nr:GAF domain-containing protein [Sterolibacterium sp.]